MKQIPLGNDRFALVDDEDFGILSYLGNWTLQIGVTGLEYAVLALGARTARYRFLMHRMIMLAPPDITVDHRDRDGLNNQRHNLRLADMSQQGCNKIKTGSRSRFKGVWPTKCGWTAMIKKDQVRHYLGHFKTDIDAALAYDAAALRLHGEFARPNFPDGEPE